MMEVLAIVLFAVSALLGLVLIPFGLPGLWVMVAGVLAYGWLTDFRSVGIVTIALTAGIAFIGEALEAWLGFRFASKHGGSRRAGWGALIGGLVGAVIGIPVPVVGSVLGAFLGAFAGAAALEYTRTRGARVALEAGWGAVLGRAAAAASKVALGLVIAVIGLVAVLRG
jgi:hypothetical protein